MNIAIVTLSTPDIKAYAQHTADINRRYCGKHKYHFVGFRDTLDATRHPAWSKIPAIKYVMDGRVEGCKPEWIMWIDADAAIVNHDINLDWLVDVKKHVVISDDLNTGVLFMRNCPYCVSVLQSMWNMTQYLNHPHWENQAFKHLYYEPESMLEQMTLTKPRKEINAFHPGEYTDGDFIAHMPGETLGAREFFFMTLADKFKSK